MTDLDRCALVIALTELEDEMSRGEYRPSTARLVVIKAHEFLEGEESYPSYGRYLLQDLHYWQEFYRKFRG